MSEAKSVPHSTLVRDIMVNPVSTVTTTMKLWQVAELFISQGFSGAPVVDQMYRMVSVIGEGLLLRLAATEGLEATVGHCLPKMPAAEKIITIHPENSFAEAYTLFLKHNIHRLPVVDANGKLQGLISRSGILRIFVEAHYGKAILRRK